MESVLCSSPTTSESSLSTISSNSQTSEKSFSNNSLSPIRVQKKNIGKKISCDDLSLKSINRLNIKPLNIPELKENLINPKNTEAVDVLSNDKDTDKIRKRSGTWPTKKNELNSITTEIERKFAAKLIKDLGIDSGKQLKNPWGNLSYSQLIEKAIESSPWKSLSLKEIYAWFTKYVPYFKDKSNYKSTMGWKNSIRHNLSLHKRFIRVAIYQRNSLTKRSSPKPIKFVWTSLRYKPKSLKSNQTNGECMLQESLYQNANILRSNVVNSQNVFNFQNYNLNQVPIVDPNQIIQFYKMLNNQSLFLNPYCIPQKIGSNIMTNNEDESEHNSPLKRVKLNDDLLTTNRQHTINPNKCTCTGCTVPNNYPAFNNFMNQHQSQLNQTSSIQKINFASQNESTTRPNWEQIQSKLHYPIPINQTSSLLSIAPRYIHPAQVMQSNLIINPKNHFELLLQNQIGLNNTAAFKPMYNIPNKSTSQSTELKPPFDLDRSNDYIINNDNKRATATENNSMTRPNTDITSNNDVIDLSTCSFKRKLLYRYKQQDVDTENCKKLKTIQNEHTDNKLTKLLDNNKASVNKVQYNENNNLNTQFLNNSNNDFDNNENFGLLKTILNKK